VAQKAAVRACRNAIEFNSIPCIQQIVPNGYAGMQIHIKIGVPDPVRPSSAATLAVRSEPYSKGRRWSYTERCAGGMLPACIIASPGVVWESPNHLTGAARGGRLHMLMTSCAEWTYCRIVTSHWIIGVCVSSAVISLIRAQETVDKAAVKAVFPYGRICCIDVVEGGLRANSGIAVAALGATWG